MSDFDYRSGGQLPSDIAAAPVTGFRVFDIEPLFHMGPVAREFTLGSTYANYHWEPVPPEGPHPRAGCQTYDQRLDRRIHLSDLQGIMDFTIPSMLPGDMLDLTVGQWNGLPGAIGFLGMPSTSTTFTNTTNTFTNVTTTISFNEPLLFEHESKYTFDNPDDARAFVEQLMCERIAYAKKHLEHVPVVSCGCGFWMTKQESDLDMAVGSTICIPGQMRAVAEVEGWGRTVEHDLGYRCEYMRIRALKLTVLSNSAVRDFRHVAEALADRYDLPVTIEQKTWHRTTVGRSYSPGYPALTRGDKFFLGLLTAATVATFVSVGSVIYGALS